MLYQSENPHGGDVYSRKLLLDYSANTNPYGTPKGVLDAITKALPDIHQYPDPYCRELVRAIAACEGVPESYILCGNGAAELIHCYCQAVRPDSALEFAPTFSEYAHALEKTDCRMIRYLLREDADFSPLEDLLTFAVEAWPQAIFLCNPNNPTGRLISREILMNLLTFTREQGIRVFLDECFMDLTGEDLSAVPLLEENPQLIILKAFTKSYGMAGVRLGYCMSADGELLSRMSAVSQPWNVSTLAQQAGIAALQEKEFLQMTVCTIAQERQWMEEQLKRCGFRVCCSKANYILFYGRTGLREALLDKGIAIRSCANYHGLGEGWYRIAVRLHSQNVLLIQAILDICGGR